TVDLPGTYGAEAAPALFAELRRGGEMLVVNGPDLADFQAAEAFLDLIPVWILFHEIGGSGPERTRALRNRVGRGRCVGLVVVRDEQAVIREVRPVPAAQPEEARTPVPAEPPAAVPVAPPAPTPEPVAQPDRSWPAELAYEEPSRAEMEPAEL